MFETEALTELVRKEMMVASPSTAEGMKCDPWTEIAGLGELAEPPRNSGSPPCPKMKKVGQLVFEGLRAEWARDEREEEHAGRRRRASETSWEMRVPATTRSPWLVRAPRTRSTACCDQPAEHRESVAHAAGAAGQVHDQGRAADAGVPRESAARGNRG